MRLRHRVARVCVGHGKLFDFAMSVSLLPADHELAFLPDELTSRSGSSHCHKRSKETRHRIEMRNSRNSCEAATTWPFSAATSGYNARPSNSSWEGEPK